MKFSPLGLALTVAAALPLAAQSQQSDNNFKWSGKIPAGGWIRIQNLNGSVSVGRASGDAVEVTATKESRRGDFSMVRILTQAFGADDKSMTICAVWDDRTSCSERGSRRRGRQRHDDVSVEFRVLVPAGVKVDLNTVNGGVTVDGATSDVEAATVNGEVEVTTSGGRVSASNVNGGVRATLGALDPSGNMEFSTVNGNVSVEFKGDSGADVEMSTVNGTINTNVEMTLRGRLNPKHLRAHVGPAGGPRIRLETVNGNIELRKR